MCRDFCVYILNLSVKYRCSSHCHFPLLEEIENKAMQIKEGNSKTLHEKCSPGLLTGLQATIKAGVTMEIQLDNNIFCQLI